MFTTTRITVFLILLLFGKARNELISPCPRLFSYEPQKESDRWYGVVTLISESDLSGVWLRLIFDRPSIQLGNWFGDIKTTDNKEYLVKNRNHNLKANMPYSLRFYIKYNPAEPVPKLLAFRLNAKTVCPEGETTTEAAITGGQLITSNQVETATKPNFGKPSGGGWSHPPATEGDDDVFQGDFQLINRPNLNPDLHPSAPTEDFECGTVVLQPRPLITHGLRTNEGEFPWHAALYLERGADLQYICGGSLISKRVVVTAAHCVTRKKSSSPISPESLVVYLGKHYLRRWSNVGIQDTQVAAIVSHPEYDSQTFANDIALIKFVNPVRITDYVRPVCLWEGANSINSVLNQPGTVVGWGYDHTGKVSEALMQTKMPVILKETCIYSFPDFFSRFTTTKTYCAGYRNGTSVCNGDSGGGMVFPKPSAVQGRRVWQLRGLVSLSVALQNQLKCDASHYAVFTDVASYMNWIKSTIGK